MRKYELAVVLSPKLEDEEREAEMEKIKGYVTNAGGTISDVDEWGKRKLAYDIQHLHEGYYYFVHFEAGPEAPAEVEGRVRIMENVLRFLCVRQDEQ